MIKEEKKFLPADFTKKVMSKIDDEIEMRRKRAALLWCVGCGARRPSGLRIVL